MPTHDKHTQGMPSWADLSTDDPAAARTFYAALFGWDYEIGGPETGHYAMATLRGRQVVGLGGKPPGVQMPSAWTVYFATDDLDATIARIKEAGGQVTMGPMQVMDAGRMAIASEPTGAVFGVWEAGQHHGAGITGEPGAFAWTEVNTRDKAKTAGFLSKVFGYEARKMEGMDYDTLHLGDQTAGGVLQMDAHWPADVPPHWMVYLAVEDTDAACARVKELGGKVYVPAFDTPYGRISVVEDPQGAVFSVIKMSQPS